MHLTPQVNTSSTILMSQYNIIQFKECRNSKKPKLRKKKSTYLTGISLKKKNISELVVKQNQCNLIIL
jgi:hypothetical protein